MDELNIFMIFSNPIFQLLIASLLGAFVGLRREFELQKKGEKGFMGLRTTASVSVLGALSTFFEQFSYLPVLFFIVLSSMIFVVYKKGVSEKKIGLTSEVSMLLIFWSGVLIGYSNFLLGIILALMVSISDAYRDKMHKFAANMEIKEWSGTLEMIIISLIILPFLPKTAIDPWGIIIPYDIWLIVVFVTAIGFVGYFLNKIFKKTKIKSIYLTSALGSLISSTAVTAQLAQKLKKDKSISNYFIPAILLAIVVMQIRSLLVILFVSQGIILKFILTPLLMFITAIILFLYFIVKKHIEDDSVELNIADKSPFEILPSLKFAAVFVLVLFATYFIKEYFGNGGIYLTTLVVALVDTESIILPALESYRQGNFSLELVSNIITIVIVMNTFMKLVYIWIFAGKKYFWKTFLPVSLILIAGAIVPLLV